MMSSQVDRYGKRHAQQGYGETFEQVSDLHPEGRAHCATLAGGSGVRFHSEG
jgi:hypothetical protein